MENQIKKYIEAKNLIQAGETVVVGVSGGPDSLCLLYALYQLKDVLSIRLVCAHLNHQARKEANADEAFVLAVCQKLAISFESKRIDVKSLAKKENHNFHQVARICRYNFFSEVMKKYEATKLATAHHADDLAETFFMRVVQNHAYEKWFGLQAKRDFSDGQLIRPLLFLKKTDILAYLKRNHYDFRVDASNEEMYYTRNRFRKYMMPFVYQENPNFIQGLIRAQQEITEDEAFLMEQAMQVFDQAVITKKQDEVILDLNCLCELRFPLQRRVIQVVLGCLYFQKGTTYSNGYIQSILSLFQQKNGYAELHLANDLYVSVNYQKGRIGYGSECAIDSYEIRIQAEGTYVLPNGYQIVVTKEELHKENFEHHLNYFYQAQSEICFPYMIRTRKAGDTIQLENNSGHKKINRLFIDQKVPLMERSGWPLLCNQENQILWVPGLKRIQSNAQMQQEDIFYIFRYIKADMQEEQDDSRYGKDFNYTRANST